MAEEVYKDIEGVPLCRPLNDGHHVLSAVAYEPTAEDVFLVSYPKCGSTWLMNILYNILNDRPPPTNFADWSRELPLLEFQGAESVREMPRPGVIRSHLPFYVKPVSEDARYIYICRNPFDCCVSYFYHCKSFPRYKFENGTFDEFFEMFMTGKLDFGDYFDHLLSGYEHRNNKNVLFLTYENLRKDVAAGVLMIADFLGEEHGRRLRDDKGRLDRVLLATSVKTMQERMNGLFKAFQRDERIYMGETIAQIGEDLLEKQPEASGFVRKGAVGDWRNHFSADQAERLKKKFASKTAGSGAASLWENVDIPQ